MTDYVPPVTEPGPPFDWDPEEATERIRFVAHRHPDHQARLLLTDIKGKQLYPCIYCAMPVASVISIHRNHATDRSRQPPQST